jgi:hypothetical protein
MRASVARGQQAQRDQAQRQALRAGSRDGLAHRAGGRAEGDHRQFAVALDVGPARAVVVLISLRSRLASWRRWSAAWLLGMPRSLCSRPSAV